MPTTLITLGVLAVTTTPPAAAVQSPPALKELQAMNARFAAVELGADLARLPAGERRALAKLVAAAKLMDVLFLDQVWAGNKAMLVDLVADETPLGRARLESFLIYKGPWSRLDHNRVVVPGAPPKPPGATFYPLDATKEELARWLAGLGADAKRAAEGFFTVVRRDPAGKLMAVPYSAEYQVELQLAAQLLREAAAATSQPSLKAYLEARAAAFASNDYYASDLAWMKLDASIEPVIGPYEVYEDEWFNAKAAFEAFVTVRDDAETDKLARFSGELQGLEDSLPIDAKHKNPKLGALAPIRVVNSIFSAGDARAGVQTAAFNLPNDERITREHGAKRVMLKNVQEAKFARVLVPIAKVALGKQDQKRVSFDAFFTHILMHELMHGLGPHEIVVAGKKTTVRAQLQETYSAIEEAKADISGLWALQQLIDRGVVDKQLEATMYVTFLASSFRSLRFGINEAHGKGIALQLNVLLDAGAYTVAKDGTFAVDAGKVKGAVAALTRRLMTLQAEGDKAAAEALLGQYVTIRPETQRVLDRLGKVPIDIAPRYTVAERLVAELAAAGDQ